MRPVWHLWIRWSHLRYPHAGDAIIAPPMPAFYTKPDGLDDLSNHTVSWVLDLFGLDTGTLKRWQDVGDLTMDQAVVHKER